VAVLAILIILPMCVFAQATGKLVEVVTDAKTNEIESFSRLSLTRELVNMFEKDKWK